jgi:cyclic pyranopterin phosphate synthase
MGNFGVKSIMFAGAGEPLLYKPVSEAIQVAKESKIDVAITTNGVLMTKEFIEKSLKYISWIKISIDAGTKESYSRIHGCNEDNFQKVLDNIKFAVEYRNEHRLDAKIGTQFLILKDNINEAEKLIQYAIKLRVDYLVFKPYSQHPSSINRQHLQIKEYDSKLTELSKKYSNETTKIIYRSETSKDINKEGIDYDICYGLDFSALIDARGDVIPCHLYHESTKNYYGNINKMLFNEIWKSQQRIDIRNSICRINDCKRGCRMNFSNKYLFYLKNKDMVEHINFI